MSEPIRDVETAVRELGALPVPVGPEPRDADTDRGLLAEQSHQLDPADPVFAALACACPEACSCDADYPGWAAGLAAADEGAER